MQSAPATAMQRSERGWARLKTRERAPVALQTVLCSRRTTLILQPDDTLASKPDMLARTLSGARCSSSRVTPAYGDTRHAHGAARSPPLQAARRGASINAKTLAAAGLLSGRGAGGRRAGMSPARSHTVSRPRRAASAVGAWVLVGALHLAKVRGGSGWHSGEGGRDVRVCTGTCMGLHPPRQAAAGPETSR